MGAVTVILSRDELTLISRHSISGTSWLSLTTSSWAAVRAHANCSNMSSILFRVKACSEHVLCPLTWLLGDAPDLQSERTVICAEQRPANMHA